MNAVGVGGPASHFEDDIKKVCGCGAIMYIRPYMDEKGIPVICLKCFIDRMKTERPDVIFAKRSLDEALRFLALTKGKRN